MNRATTLVRGTTRTEANRHPDRTGARAECAAASGRAATVAETPASDCTAVDATARPATEMASTAEDDR
ncbi:hypothetical protein [Natrinema sp. 74]|uniref:hypothetical protein n=1 Tax=Natrinema sp. 74 TaxID=3384159 RepID=UPI0038D37799